VPDGEALVVDGIGNRDGFGVLVEGGQPAQRAELPEDQA